MFVFKSFTTDREIPMEVKHIVKGAKMMRNESSATNETIAFDTYFVKKYDLTKGELADLHDLYAHYISE